MENGEEQQAEKKSPASLEGAVDNLRKLLEENLRYTKVVHEFTPKDADKRQKEYHELLKENTEYTKACYAVLEKLQRWVFWQKVFTILKIVLFVVPVVLGIIYLPPLLSKLFQPYLELFQSL